MTSVEWFHINHAELATLSLICLVTLTFDLLTLKLVRIIACGVGNLSTILPILGFLGLSFSS